MSEKGRTEEEVERPAPGAVRMRQAMPFALAPRPVGENPGPQARGALPKHRGRSRVKPELLLTPVFCSLYQSEPCRTRMHEFPCRRNDRSRIQMGTLR